ncbi:cytochrome c oxidase assembly protein [Stakelama saccharophila]|uniref:Cytochrome c oxidase assembly protein CtaG n=1 Tax=Stakelama saccharophila TaxID=3075605 RepID=A0ABZ0BE18_9SPHN|nr:cytochrome c oxidase assembly protein [Stakelama sp. W311]WNO55193.1 cytochrome c oxidase assembly protein [Stakelama sp. W311]
MLGVTIVIVMGGLGFASVPLYRAFCQITGLNGTPQVATAAPGAVGRTMTVAFDSNVSPRLDWRFEPERRADTVQIGARDMAFFRATNRSDRPLTGTATFNVTPAQAGRYFTKIQCFCFTQQTLAPGETARMPVIFFVDPGILGDPDTRDVEEITLSYTFYPVDSDENAS